MKVRTSLSLLGLAVILLGTACISAQGFQPVGVSGAKQAVPYVVETLSLRIHNYSHVNRKALLAAESEATSILASAGIDVRWVDCPVSPADLDRYPDCPSASLANDYTLNIEPNAMAELLVKSPTALGATVDCDRSPCTTSVFYDRVRDLAGGNTAPSEVLLGRVMARQIGQLFLGTNYHAQTGIMQESWSNRELGFKQVFFAPQESRLIKARMIEQELAWQSQHVNQAYVTVADSDDEPGASPSNRDIADNRR